MPRAENRILADGRGPLRVIHLAPFSFHPHVRTFVAVMRSISEIASSRDCTAEIVVKPEAREREWVKDLTDSSIPVRFLPTNPRIVSVRGLTALLGESTLPTVLHCHFTSYDVAAAIAGARHPNAAVFWHVHSFLQSELTIRVRNYLRFRLLGRFVERILCVAPHLVDGVVERGAPREKVLLFPNAIESNRFPLVTADMRAEARTTLGISLGADVLLHFGWNSQIKGTDIFLQAVQNLAREGRHVLGMTVGADDEAHSLRKSLGLEDSTSIVATRNDVETLYAAADVFVAAGRSEGAPTAILEALCCGLPVVATDIAGHRVDVRAGRMVQKADVDGTSLAAAIGNVLDARGELAREAASVRDQLLAERDLRPWSTRLFALYEEALASTRAG